MLDFSRGDNYKIKFRNKTECEHFANKFTARSRLIRKTRTLYNSKIEVLIGVLFKKNQKLLKFFIIKIKNGIPQKKFKITKHEYDEYINMKNEILSMARIYE
jgi:hypothetical protein